MNKIHICGIYGCGKSTLAQRLSKLEGIPYYNLDDLKYEVRYNKTRSVSERIDLLSKICAKEEWITEGTWTNYAEEAFAMADLVIHMAFPPLICDYHILMRFISRKKEESDNMFGVLELMRQVHKYYSEDGIVSFRHHQLLINTYRKKSVLLQNKREIEEFVNYLNKLKND